MTRNICIHYHIFKNAGSTVDYILKNNFDEEFLAYDGPHPGSILPSEYLNELIKDYPQIKAISSHQGRFPVPEDGSYRTYPIVFIRNPIDRTGSLYSYFSRGKGASLPEKISKEGGIKEYVEWSLSPEGHKTCSNFQTAYCSDRINFARKQPGEKELREAVERIRALDFIGVVDQFDESLVLLTEYFCDSFSDFNPDYVRQNVSKERSGGLEEKIDDMKTQLGSVLFNRLVEDNRLDLQLYEEAKCLLNHKIQSDPSFSTKLSQITKGSTKQIGDLQA